MNWKKSYGDSVEIVSEMAIRALLEYNLAGLRLIRETLKLDNRSHAIALIEDIIQETQRMRDET